MVDRSESFVAWHEPEPCDYCDDDLVMDRDPGDPDKVTSQIQEVNSD
jgi:hypothetical protein